MVATPYGGCCLGISILIMLPLAVSSSTSTTSAKRPALVQRALFDDGDIYYFGLGSNMLRSKLENRAIDGSQIKLKSFEPAFVENHRLAFNMRGFPPLEPGMGSLEPVNDDSDGSDQSKPLVAYEKNQCHGSLVRLSAKDYEKLMRSEGVGNGRPDQGYEEVVVKAMPYKKGKAPVQAIALRAREHVRLKQDPAPSQRYMQILRQGADELGLDARYKEFLQRHPVAENSPLTRRIAVCNLVWTAMISFRLKVRAVSKVQSWLLWRVYVPPTTNFLAQAVGELATAGILLPGAIPGSCLLLFHTLFGKGMSPMMKSMVDSHW